LCFDLFALVYGLRLDCLQLNILVGEALDCFDELITTHPFQFLPGLPIEDIANFTEYLLFLILIFLEQGFERLLLAACFLEFPREQRYFLPGVLLDVLDAFLEVGAFLAVDQEVLVEGVADVLELLEPFVDLADDRLHVFVVVGVGGVGDGVGGVRGGAHVAHHKEQALHGGGLIAEDGGRPQHLGEFEHAVVEVEEELEAAVALLHLELQLLLVEGDHAALALAGAHQRLPLELQFLESELQHPDGFVFLVDDVLQI
jgi:hypothetical protein